MAKSDLDPGLCEHRRDHITVDVFSLGNHAKATQHNYKNNIKYIHLKSSATAPAGFKALDRFTQSPSQSSKFY